MHQCENVRCWKAVNFVAFVVWWGDFVSNSKVMRKVLCRRVQSLEQALNQNRFKCLGHVLFMPTEQLPRMLFFEVGDS